MPGLMSATRALTLGVVASWGSVCAIGLGGFGWASPAWAQSAASAASIPDFVAPPASDEDAQALAKVIAGPQRTDAYRARDVYRHPAETLTFFGLRPGMSVVEIWPGNGWYTEILAPYLYAHGLLYEALPEEANSRASAQSASTRESVAFSQKLAAKPQVYGKAVVVPFAPPSFTDVKPPGGADLVLTFRNVHNWIKSGTTDQVFKAMFAALKPGGTLGVVEHRAKPGTSVEKMIASGYVTESYVIEHAQAAGFKLAARSEINANLRDTTDHPHGVWSLPPAYAGGDQDRQTFKDIGESDRMTLRFVKPN